VADKKRRLDNMNSDKKEYMLLQNDGVVVEVW
jgi:hypothetical protein